MKSQSVLVYLTVLSILIASVLGCTKKKDTAQPPTESGSPAPETTNEDIKEDANAIRRIETVADFNHVLAAWDAGNRQEATERLIQIDWDKPGVFANVPSLDISEQYLTTSSQDQQMQIIKKLSEFNTKLRELGLHILSVGDTSLASGDKQASQTHYEALLKCAQSLASKDGAGGHQIEARGFIKAVEDRLSAVELGQDYQKQVLKQVDEVRRTFLALQQVCKANDVDRYLYFSDYETKMATDGRDLDLDQRRQRTRQSLARRPQTLQEIANAKIESITVDYWEPEKIEVVHGAEIKGTMMLVRTTGLHLRVHLRFHQTPNGWKLYNMMMMYEH
jgi:hypothetical protein